MFQKEEYVVYKKEVCKIIDIDTKDNQDYYVLVPINDNSLKIRIPIRNKNIDLRKILTRQEAEKIINSIPNILPLLEVEDRFIEGEYKSLLQNGTHEDILKILKTAYLRKEQKKKLKRRVNEKDIYYQELAEKYLFHEFSIAYDCSFDEVKNSINNLLKETVTEI